MIDNATADQVIDRLHSSKYRRYISSTKFTYIEHYTKQISYNMREMVYVGDKELLGEVIRVDEQRTMIQVYESTTGLRPGEPVRGTGSLLNATLGPGILRNIYDGIERPLKKIMTVVYAGLGLA